MSAARGIVVSLIEPRVEVDEYEFLRILVGACYKRLADQPDH
jgi:hypothetical protein